MRPSSCGAPERKRLLAHLGTFGAPDPDERADAALKAAELLARKGPSRPVLIPAAGKGDDAPFARLAAGAGRFIRRPENSAPSTGRGTRVCCRAAERKGRRLHRVAVLHVLGCLGAATP